MKNKIRKFYHKIRGIERVSIYRKKYNKLKLSNFKKISVIVPNYNYEKYIIERIDSILFQTYPIYELIILDDCSTDNSVEVIKNKIKTIKDLNVKFISNTKNSGSVFSQWQKGFQESSGDYIWIAEADDSCHPEFLEEVMKGFNDSDVVVSYAESMRINEKNEIISKNCRDWMTASSKNHWNKSYIKNGIDELRECMCVCNTIPNVSAVVFKRKNQIELLNKCKEFKVSGDWYLYFKLLQNGKIFYCHKSLNYFRKHSNSTSTIAKKSIELEEVLIIQKAIRDYAKLDSDMIMRQSYRYGGLVNEVEREDLEKMKKMMAKKIAWIIPFPIKGSGGIRTMIQNANFLVRIGYECDIFVEEDFVTTDERLKKIIIKLYGECLCNTYVGIDLNKKQYDLVFGTYSIQTADYAANSNIPHKAYFIQDFEPWFEPMGGLYLKMERTYKIGLEGISIGKWLSHKLSEEYHTSMHYFNFCADLSVYKKLENVEKEEAICYIFQPEKPRRASNIGINALYLVKKLRPNVKIYLYGSDADVSFPTEYGIENLKIQPIEKCNELYNKCTVGLCISSSNPSRIPFEMMASGLPVVDLFRENNLYDIPDSGVLLADSTPEAIATALIKILDDKKLRNSLSENGYKYMRDYPLERGYEQFGEFVDNLLNDSLDNNVKFEKIYNRDIIMPSDEVLAISKEVIGETPMPRHNTSNNIRFLVRLKRFIKRKISAIFVALIKGIDKL